MSDKLIVLMVDGVSAEHYALDKVRFPHFAALEARGFRVERLHSEVLGTSLPGRTSMITGATADVSGVYGNKIWGGKHFRYANPDDVRVSTIPGLAKAAGKTVAVMGFGMIRPEDAHIFKAPWWVGEFVQRARDTEPADAAWVRAATFPLDERFEKACEAAGVSPQLPSMDVSTEAARAFYGILADFAITDWIAALAVSPDAPDLIIAEFLTTDSIQHKTGYRSAMSHWSVEQADMAVGRLIERLRSAGVLDEWNIAVMSDHGHSAIETALHPAAVIPGVQVQCEGGSLLVAPKDAAELDHVTTALAAYGVEPYPNTCVPAEMRDQVYVFVAPPGMSFEDDDPNATEPLGKPNNISSHGLRPGFPGDDRFALFAGPGVPNGCIAEANAAQVAPTFAALLGLSVEDFAAAPLFTAMQ